MGNFRPAKHQTYQIIPAGAAEKDLGPLSAALE